jgi:hypothetical protein
MARAPQWNAALLLSPEWTLTLFNFRLLDDPALPRL